MAATDVSEVVRDGASSTNVQLLGDILGRRDAGAIGAPATDARAELADRDSARIGRNSTFLPYIQTMRTIAIGLVVGTHAWHALPVWTSMLPFLFFRHVNLMFMFVAGYLFQYLLQRFSYGRYLKTKLQTVLLPYFLVSIPLILIYVLGLKEPGGLHAPDWVEGNKLLLTLHMLVTGTHLAPLWFIPVIALIYLAAPALKFIDERPRLYWLVVPALVAAAFIERPADNENPLRAFGFYLPTYMIGMAACHYRDSVIPVVRRVWPLLLAVALLPLLFPGFSPAHDYLNMLSKIVFCFGTVGFLSLHAHRAPQWFNRIGDLSFGIYFVHGFVTAAISIVAVQRQLPLQGLGGFLAVFAVAMTVSIAVVLVVKAIFGTWSRRVIGA